MAVGFGQRPLVEAQLPGVAGIERGTEQEEEDEQSGERPVALVELLLVGCQDGGQRCAYLYQPQPVFVELCDVVGIHDVGPGAFQLLRVLGVEVHGQFVQCR